MANLPAFKINARIRIKWSDDILYDALVIQINNETNQIKLSYEGFSDDYDEWIAINDERIQVKNNEISDRERAEAIAKYNQPLSRFFVPAWTSNDEQILRNWMIQNANQHVTTANLNNLQTLLNRD
eukprot:73201_1